MRYLILAIFAVLPLAVQAQCVVPANGVAMVRGIYDGVDAERRAMGLRALAIDESLARAAQIHACDIAGTGTLDHHGSDGTNSLRRVVQAGFRSCLTAENLAWGYPAPAQIMAGWMGSSGHRANILLDRVSAMGVGVAQGPDGPMWVLDIARHC